MFYTPLNATTISTTNLGPEKFQYFKSIRQFPNLRLHTVLVHYCIIISTLVIITPCMQERLTASLSEQEALSSLVAKLRQEMGVARREVEEERANARLLMDYPFVKQTAEGYHRHVESMLASGGESHRQISANTVRILLLEEQNGELREGIVSSAMQGRRDGKHFQVLVLFFLFSLSLPPSLPPSNSPSLLILPSL